jgi:hypothetical protein
MAHRSKRSTTYYQCDSCPTTPSTHRQRDQCSGRQDKQEEASEANRKEGNRTFQHRHLLRLQPLCTLSKMLQLLITCWMRSRKSMAGCRRNSGKQLSEAWQTWSFFILDKWTQTTTTMRTSIPTLLQKSTTLIRPCLTPIPQQNLWQSPARHS